MSDLDRTVLYINVIVQDASEAAQTKMMEKIDKTSMPEGFKNAAKRIGAKAASKLATPSAVAAKMSEKIPKKIPEEMAQKGMTAEVESVFLEGPYLVIQLQVQNLDTQMMAEIKAEEKRQEWGLIRLITMAFLYWLLRVLGAKHLKTLDEEILPNVVQKKMEPMLNEMLQIKLEEEMKVDAETLVLSEDKQARYFYNKLKEIRSATKKGV